MIAEGFLAGWTEAGWAVLLVVLIWSLANCFLGYFAFRILVVVDAAVAGLLLGGVLAVTLRDHPSTLDYLVACGGLAVIAALAAWFCPRATFSAIAGLGIASGAALGLASGQLGPGVWTCAGLLGLATGIVCYLYVERLVLFLTGAAGSVCTILCVAEVFGWSGSPGTGSTTVLIFFAAGLAVAGMCSQMLLARLVTDSMTPRAAGRRRSPGPTMPLHPRFTKI